MERPNAAAQDGPAAGSAPVAGSRDLELAARLRQGDGAALAPLDDRCAARVFALARTILLDDRLAAEAAQDVFLALWQQPAAYEPARGTFPGWLLRVTRNRAFAPRRRRREQPLAADPADQAAGILLRGEVRAALARLAPDHHRLLEMASFDGLSQRQIAERLGRSPATVKTQIRTAMQCLAEQLSAHRAEGDPAAATAPRSRPDLGGKR